MSWRKLLAVGTVAGLAGLAVVAQGEARAGGQAKGAAPAPVKTAEAPSEAELALGKKIFVAKCASCHGEDGKKPVGEGLPLSERTLSDEGLAKMVRGRLKSSPENEQKAVTAYIRSIQKK